jgi:CubicO group peptidase (beta-lactamase class C family)
MRMKKGSSWGPILVLILLSLASAQGPARQGAGDPFESIKPEEAGFSSERLTEVTKYLEKIGSAAFLALYDGKVFLSWGHIDRKYWCHSIRKALLNSLYGISFKRGIIDPEATIGSLGIDDIDPRLSPDEKKAKVIDLLQSRSGIYHPAAAESEDMAAERPARGSHPPGTFHYYNNWDFNVLGAIFEKAAGRSIFEAFEKEIARPLGMPDFRAEDGRYHYEKDKSIHPAYQFKMTARDLALYGLLYLRGGIWEGRRIIPKEWIDISTQRHSVHDEKTGLGYGYLWGVLPENSPFGKGFFHSGLGVHTLLILPDSRLVIVHRVDTEAPYSMTSQNLFQVMGLLMAAKLAK